MGSSAPSPRRGRGPTRRERLAGTTADGRTNRQAWKPSVPRQQHPCTPSGGSSCSPRHLGTPPHSGHRWGQPRGPVCPSVGVGGRDGDGGDVGERQKPMGRAPPARRPQGLREHLACQPLPAWAVLGVLSSKPGSCCRDAALSEFTACETPQGADRWPSGTTQPCPW